jgi:tetratricopeptide (TPR) repeat protein
VAERSILRNAHWGRAAALHGLGRYADAVKDWDRALALGPDRARERDLRFSRAVSLGQAGEHAKAVAEANALAAAADVDSGTLYNLACVVAVVSAAVKNANTPGADASRLAETYSARAIELLQLAVAKGYKDAALMKKDKDLDAVRDREDFKRLVAKLEGEERLARTTVESSSVTRRASTRRSLTIGRRVAHRPASPPCARTSCRGVTGSHFRIPLAKGKNDNVILQLAARTTLRPRDRSGRS